MRNQSSATAPPPEYGGDNAIAIRASDWLLGAVPSVGDRRFARRRDAVDADCVPRSSWSCSPVYSTTGCPTQRRLRASLLRGYVLPLRWSTSFGLEFLASQVLFFNGAVCLSGLALLVLTVLGNDEVSRIAPAMRGGLPNHRATLGSALCILLPFGGSAVTAMWLRLPSAPVLLKSNFAVYSIFGIALVLCVMLLSAVCHALGILFALHSVHTVTRQMSAAGTNEETCQNTNHCGPSTQA